MAIFLLVFIIIAKIKKLKLMFWEFIYNSIPIKLQFKFNPGSKTISSILI